MIKKGQISSTLSWFGATIFIVLLCFSYLIFLATGFLSKGDITSTDLFSGGASNGMIERQVFSYFISVLDFGGKSIFAYDFFNLPLDRQLTLENNKMICSSFGYYLTNTSSKAFFKSNFIHLSVPVFEYDFFTMQFLFGDLVSNKIASRYDCEKTIATQNTGGQGVSVADSSFKCSYNRGAVRFKFMNKNSSIEFCQRSGF